MRKFLIGFFGAAIAVGVLIAATWPTLPFAIEVLSSDRPPELLTDFEWPERMESIRISQRFTAGSSENDLLDWLDRNEFERSAGDRIAARGYSGLPCAYAFEVSWNAENGSLSEDAKATVTEYSCL